MPPRRPRQPRRLPAPQFTTRATAARIAQRRQEGLAALAASVRRDVAARQAPVPARPTAARALAPPPQRAQTTHAAVAARAPPAPRPQLQAPSQRGALTTAARAPRRLISEAPRLAPGGRAIGRQRQPGRSQLATPANISFRTRTVRTHQGYVETTYNAVHRVTGAPLLLTREDLFRVSRALVQRQGGASWATFAFGAPNFMQFRGISGRLLTGGSEAEAREAFMRRLSQYESDPEGLGGSGPLIGAVAGHPPALDTGAFAILHVDPRTAARLPAGPSRRGLAPRGTRLGFPGSTPMGGIPGGPALIPIAPQPGPRSQGGCVAAVGEAWGLAVIHPVSGAVRGVYCPFPEADADGFVDAEEGLAWLQTSLDRCMAPAGEPWAFAVIHQNVIGQEGIYAPASRMVIMNDFNSPEVLAAGGLWVKGRIFIPVAPWHVAMIGRDVEDPERIFFAVVDVEAGHVAAAASVVRVPERYGGGWAPGVSDSAYHGPKGHLFVLAPHGRVDVDALPEGTFASRPPLGPLPASPQTLAFGAKELLSQQPQLKSVTMLPPRWTLKPWSTPRKMWANVTPPGTAVTLYYDFETVYGVDALLVPYAVAFLLVPNSELESDELDAESLPRRARVLVGYDCAREFVKYVAELIHSDQYAEVVLAGFNSARFDAFFLMQAVYELQEARGQGMYVGAGTTYQRSGAANDAFYNGPGNARTGLSLTMGKFFFTKGALLTAELRGWGWFGNSPHCTGRLFDLARHIPGASLANLAKAFNTPHRKVDGFSHADAQAAYDANPATFLLNDDFVVQLERYNRFDVVVLAELHHAYLKALRRLIPETMARFADDPKGLPLTLGSLTRQHWEWSVKDKLDALPWRQGERGLCTVSGGWEPFGVDEYKVLRTAMVGGRCQLPNGPLTIHEPTEELDCTSMYPFVSAAYAVRYPVGTMSAVAAPSCGNGERLGIYRVDVDQGPLMDVGRVGLVARKEWSPAGAMLRNNWGERHVYDVWVTTPILALLEECGARVVHRGGFEWSHTIKSVELFECLLAFMAEKNRMDVAKAEGSPEYNPALRNLCKLLMNALYGQMLRGIFERTTVSVTGEQFEKLEADVAEGKLVRINCLKMIHRTVFADIVRRTEDRIDKQSPNILGYYILGYAQEYMARHLWLKIPRPLLLYMDTDCARAARATFADYVVPYLSSQPIPVWPEVEAFDPNYRTARMYGNDFSIFGAFTPGAPPENTGAVFASKKFYCLLGEDGSVALENGNPVVGMKGIRQEDVILPEETVLWLQAQTDPVTLLRVCKGLYHATPETVPTLIRVGTSAHVLLERIIREGRAWVLSSSLNRITWNLLSGVGMREHERQQANFGRIRQVFLLKRLSVARTTPDPDEVFVVGQPAGDAEEEAAAHVETYAARYDRLFIGGDGDDGLADSEMVPPDERVDVEEVELVEDTEWEEGDVEVREGGGGEEGEEAM